MSTLAEIEKATENLPLQDKQELIFFLLGRLRETGDKLPLARDIPKEKIEQWIKEDEADYKAFLAEA